MDKENKSKNLCLIQYAHSINFKKKLPDQPKLSFPGKKIIAKDLQKTSNKENETPTSANQTKKFNSSDEFHKTRSPSTPRSKSLLDLIETLSFRNRNLQQVIRIREEALTSQVSKQKFSLFTQLGSLEPEIESLEASKADLLKKQNDLLFEGTGKLLSENALLTENIQNLKEKILALKKSTVEMKVYQPLRQEIKGLEQAETECFRTSQELKNKLRMLRFANENSERVRVYLEQKKAFLEIFGVISKMKVLILRIINKEPIRGDGGGEGEREEDGRSVGEVVKGIFEKSSSLRKLVSDKFAEKYTDGCKMM